MSSQDNEDEKEDIQINKDSQCLDEEIITDVEDDRTVVAIS